MSSVSVKDRLLETASRLFYRQGYNLTGINQILAESDAAIGSLYKHYPSKVDLLMAYLEKANEIYFTAINAHINKYADPADRIRAFFDFHIGFQVEGDFVGCNFMKVNAEIAREEPRVEAVVQNHKAKVRALVQDLVGELKTADNPDLLSDTIYLLFEGAMIDTTIQRNLHYLHRAKAIIDKWI